MFAQQPPSKCGAPPSILQSTQPNIFSEQQEQWLGEAMADYSDRVYRPVKNAAESDYAKTIGARLLAVLPPTKIEFHFTVVESSEINGFSLAGGRVYLTRKLIASARSEDEVAGVIAHEMGHILTHQFAIETTADLRRLLGVTSVGDRADVYAKFQRLTDARQHQKHQADADSDDKQDQADRVAVYAAAAAGYRPQAYAEFWDRSFFVGGKTGSHLSDFFGATTTTQKRLRRIRGLVAELPSGCGAATETASSPAFLQWQHQVLENQAASPEAATEKTTADSKTTEMQLGPPLRLDIDHVRFSRDGKYVLAQDESSIFVLSREPFKELFRIDAERAMPADFSPDSQSVAFATSGLHVEKWSISEKKLITAHEVVAEHTCLQMQLAPDGRTIACIYFNSNADAMGFSLIDVETGQIVFEKKSWFVPNFNFELAVYFRRILGDTNDVLTSSLSSDGNILLIGPGSDRLAVDLRSRTQIKIEGALKSYDYPNSYCFLGSDKVAAVQSHYGGQSGVFSFPDGKRLKQLNIGLPYMHSTTGGDLILTDGPKDSGSPFALADINTGKYILGFRSSAVDFMGGWYVAESLNGAIGLGKLNSTDPKENLRAPLPLSPLAPATSASLSPDGRYLALSERTRGTVWDLETGKSSILVRGFQSGWWAPDGKFLAEYPAHDKLPRMISEMVMSKPPHMEDMSYKLAEKAHLEDGHLFEWKQEKKNWTFTASSPFDAKEQWTRSFNDGRPSYTINVANSDLILSYGLQTPLAKEKLRNDTSLRDQSNAVKEKASGRIIEIVNSADGSARGQVVIEVPRTYEGVDGFNAVGDLLYLSTGDNRTIVYSFKTGAQLRQFFGTVVAADVKSEIIAVINRRDEVIVLDKTGTELQHQSLGSPLRYANLREDGGKLLVLTADQRIRRFPVAAH